jgi:hypothetical protein
MKNELPKNLSAEEIAEQEKIDQGWEESRQNEVINGLLAGEDLQKIMEPLVGFKESFRELDTVDCSDGRVLDGHKIGIAGSGLLLSEEERALFIERFKGKIKTLTAHSDCGAAAKKFATLNINEIPAGVKTADEYGVYCAKKLAAELGANYEYLNREEMANEYHNEVALVLDSTAEFDSTNLKGFPAHFVSTGAGLGFSEDYMKSELETLAGIALGHHGFGSRFDSENPFYVIVSANNSEELNHWQKIAEEAVAQFGADVSVKGFIRPKGIDQN